MNALSSQTQSDIFTSSQNQLHFAELCNALYERELRALALQTAQADRLKRRLSGLSYHIRATAEKLLDAQTPLTLDSHNASWQHKQASQCPADKIDPAKNLEWFTRYSRLGLAVAVYVNELGVRHLELDSIDRVDLPALKLHSNKFGWFEMNGEHRQQTQQASPNLYYQLNRPSKTLLTAASCGHRWNHKGKTQPRALAIRELLISTTINWKNYR